MMSVLERLLRYAAIVFSLLLIVGFALFVYDQGRDDSQRNVDKVAGIDRPDPSAESERIREKRHSSAREAIDDANDIMLKPFAGIVHSKDVWVDRLVPTLLALLVFGFGLGFLARYTQARS